MVNSTEKMWKCVLSDISTERTVVLCFIEPKPSKTTTSLDMNSRPRRKSR